MQAKHSKVLESALNLTQREASRIGGHALSADHILLGILKQGEGHAVEILHSILTDTQCCQVQAKLEQALKEQVPERDPSRQRRTESELAFMHLESVLRNMYLEMLVCNHKTLHTGLLLLTLLRDKQSAACRILNQYGVTYYNANSVLAVLSPDEDRPGAKPENTMDDDQNSYDFTDDADGDPYGESEADFFDEGESSASPSRMPGAPAQEQRGGEKTSMLEKFGVDLTRSAEQGRLDPVIGRTTEIERLVQVLGRYKKNNPILVGEAGVGKSAIVEGLAMRIAAREVPHTLLSKRVFTLDIASLVAGTKYRGQFEERIKALLNEITKDKDIILFIDEIHTIVGAGSTQGTLDTANILKPALARGELQCIGATTLDEYREFIESDGALERRFQKILVEPTTKEDTLNILRQIKGHYENHHLVNYTDEAVEACVTLSDRYITDRYFPDKAIDVLDEAGSKAHTFEVTVPAALQAMEEELENVRNDKREAVAAQHFEEAAQLRNREADLKTAIESEGAIWAEEMKTNRVVVDRAFIDRVVSAMTGIPADRVSLGEQARLREMERTLGNVVVGQEDAVKKVTRAIQRSRAGLKDPNRPIGTFMFVGPTGVGKTHLAKELAKFMFDREDALIRVDMSEYSEKHNVSRLIGSPPGYVGYAEGGQLTEKVRRHPYSVILFDEIEKAHPDVFNVMLQLFDDGCLTDGSGRKVDFRNCILIMTSNVGSKLASDFGGGLGYNTTAHAESLSSRGETLYRKALAKTFAPEFINRIDDIIVFNTLSEADVEQIVDLEVSAFNARVEALGYRIGISDPAKARLVALGYEPKYGVRSLKRAILDHVEERFAEMIIDGSVIPGGEVLVDCDGDDFSISLRKS